MFRFILILILTLNFQTLTKADDIKEYQIEEMAIGDSLLDYVNKKEIIKNMITSYPGSKKFSRFYKKFAQYEHVHFHFKTNDKKFIIHGIEGLNYFPNDLAKCQKKRELVISDIMGSLKDSKLINMERQENLEKDGSIRSETYNSYIEFDNGFLDITCTNWSKTYKENNKSAGDSLQISFITKELDDWLTKEAWN